jgi:Raf kinase inhibitor-like YbhB/YbcL family protein
VRRKSREDEIMGASWLRLFRLTERIFFCGVFLLVLALFCGGCSMSHQVSEEVRAPRGLSGETAAGELQDSTTKRGISEEVTPEAPDVFQPEKGGPQMKLESTAFRNQSPIPRDHTEDGRDVSPPLKWSDPPAGTKEFAIICDDPDAPSPRRPAPEPWVHWVIYGIPADVRELPAGIPAKEKLDTPRGAVQGKNSWGTVGYRGPAPPRGSGRHRYVFTLYALDTSLGLAPGATKAQLLKAMEGHVLATAQWIGTYERP